MATDWTVKKNHAPGRQIFSFKAEAVVRLVVKLTKQQNSVLHAYCDQNNIKPSDFVRKCIGDYLAGVNFDLPEIKEDDPNQLKLYPEDGSIKV